MAKRTDMDEHYADVVINSLRQDNLDILPPTHGATPTATPPAATDNGSAGQETAESGKPSKKKPPAKERWQEYEERFVRESEITARRGRQVYIRPEFHDRIQKIIQVVGGNGISMASYVDNVLAAHFEEYRDGITESFNRHIKSFNI